jgi:hypothetical protein
MDMDLVEVHCLPYVSLGLGFMHGVISLPCSLLHPYCYDCVGLI